MSKSQENFVTFELWIICKYKKEKRGQKGLEYYVYVTYKVTTSLTHIHQCYRQLFGIEREGRWGFPSLSNHAVETSYRLKNLYSFEYFAW